MKKTDKTVLIIEDSPAQALALESLLREEGLGVLWAPDGKVGLHQAQVHAPDAILLDIEMPEMDGFEACKQLKRDDQTAGIPIVMLTVRDDASTALHSMDLGAIDFVPKDAFCGPILLETLRQLRILPRSDNRVPVTEGDWTMADE